MASSNAARQTARHDPYAALRVGDFRLLLLGRFLLILGEQMLNVAIGWEIFVRTHSALKLGFVGLALVLPVLLFALPAGQFVDRVSAKRVLLGGYGLLALCALGLYALSTTSGPLFDLYALLFLIGAATAFTGPASMALLSQLVPEASLANAATWSSSTGDLAAVLGPALGGALIAVTGHAAMVYLLFAAGSLLDVVLIVQVRPRPIERSPAEPPLRAIAEGLRFVGKTQVILAAITLDLFAVLLGGATTLMPIFALQILHVGPVGLGLLRAAPSLGAVGMAVLLAHRGPFKRGGLTFLGAVAGFGAATVVFGFSRLFPLSIAMLIALGALDMISVVTRDTLMLTRTPQEMLGRVSSVDNIFVGASNELGGFESGLTAAIFGPVLSVVGGGIGTIFVVLAVAAIWPELRRLGRLDPHAEQRALTEHATTDLAGTELARADLANEPLR